MSNKDLKKKYYETLQVPDCSTPDNPTEAEIQARIKYYQECWAQKIEPDVYPRWHTPIAYVDAIREVLGGIDLDPASCDIAQRRIQAKTYYTPENDAFGHSWLGTVMLNPYHTEESRWFEKAITEYRAGHMTAGIIITHTKCTYEDWFHDLLVEASAVCFIKGRINWIADHVVDEIAAKRCGITLDIKHDKHGTVIFYLGGKPDKFVDIFRGFGWTIKT